MFKAFLDRYADPDWRQAHHWYSLQLSLFMAVVGGLWVALPALQSLIPPIHFVIACVFGSLTMLFARLAKQPDLDR